METNYLDDLNRQITEQTQYLESVKKYSEMDMNEAFAIDPGTIVAAAEVVLNLISMLSSDNNTDKIFEQIKNGLDKLVSLLLDVLQLIKDLQEAIEENTRNFIITHLRSILAIASYSYPTWKIQLASTNIEERQQVMTEITNHFTSLSTSIGQSLFYGYQHYDSIGLAFATEIQLSVLLNKPNEFKSAMSQKYISYFDDAVNTAKQKTLGSNYLGLINLNNSLEASHKGGSWSFISRDYLDECLHWEDVEHTLRIEGNILKGFTASTSDRVVARGGRRCMPFVDYSKLDPISYSAASLASINFSAIIADYNWAHSYYLQNLTKIKLLKEAIDNCKNYKVAIDNYISSL